jgi:hypothetical protein
MIQSDWLVNAIVHVKQAYPLIMAASEKTVCLLGTVVARFGRLQRQEFSYLKPRLNSMLEPKYRCDRLSQHYWQ